MLEQKVMKAEETESKVVSSTHDSGKAVVGKTLQFDGNIKGDEDLIIEGIVEGIIILNNASVTVANKGLVRGDIIARTILVEGEVRGEMRGNEMVEIAPTGIVHGDIRAPRVLLQDGCQFKGLVDMDHKETALVDRKRPPQPVSPAARKQPGLKKPPKLPTLSSKS
jgi:cytoskeletal protein CcmA (bactofilin family)